MCSIEHARFFVFFSINIEIISKCFCKFCKIVQLLKENGDFCPCENAVNGNSIKFQTNGGLIIICWNLKQRSGTIMPFFVLQRVWIFVETNTSLSAPQGNVFLKIGFVMETKIVITALMSRSVVCKMLFYHCLLLELLSNCLLLFTSILRSYISEGI